MKETFLLLVLVGTLCVATTTGPADTWPLVISLWPTYLTDRMRAGYLVMSDEALAREPPHDLIRD